MKDHGSLEPVLKGTFGALERASRHHRQKLSFSEIGFVTYAGRGIARVDGLPGARSEELLELSGGIPGLAFNVDPGEVGVILLDDYGRLSAGDSVRRTGRVLDVPVGQSMLGRVIDPLGRPLDDRGPIVTTERRPAERPAPGIMERSPVTVPLATGIKVIDALIPIGRGQRELILGDRQTGKTSVAIDAIANQKSSGLLCVYCAVGQRSSGVARVISELEKHEAMEYTIVIAAEGDDPPGLQYIAPYTATSIAEYFMEQGRDVLIVYDDLTRHARAYRELSLLLRRPPGREAFPGDIFYVHSRLLERSTRLREELGGGSLTALPIVETEAQNLSAYIPTNLISITDGQIYLSPALFQKGLLPAVDVGVSVSRVGGKAQLPAYRAVAGDLRLTYSQFEELETFARFGTRLDEETKRTINRGRKVRAVLKQPLLSPRSPAEQVTVLHAVNRGVFDDVDDEKVPAAEEKICLAAREYGTLAAKVEGGEKLTGEDLDLLEDRAREAAGPYLAAGERADGNR
jgi:F-type H+-transporting ATPase subunit alpha